MVLVQKLPIFQLLFLGNTVQKNVFYDIVQQKNACLRYKNTKFIFPKGLTHAFGAKMVIFPTFFF